MSYHAPALARADAYTRITSEVIAAIEAGAGAWRMPWHHDGKAITRPTNLASGKRYRGINVLALWIAATSSGYVDGLWGTYRQWQTAGAQVRKGEHATSVVLWKEMKRKASTDKDEEEEDLEGRPRLFARTFFVFNRAQVDGYEAPTRPQLAETTRFAQADLFFAALEIAMVSGAYDAHYRIDEDRIYMPSFGTFEDPASYAGTLFHEAGHATGAKRRLDRDFGARFAGRARAMEEAVAELTASFILADLGIAHRPRPDHAAYIASWLELLKDDPKAIFTASSKAQQAADWMHARQPTMQQAVRSAA
jgi:antirestriction protein ArdC